MSYNIKTNAQKNNTKTMRIILTDVREYVCEVHSITLKWNVISVRNCDTKI